MWAAVIPSGEGFAYYETIAGGMGGRPGRDGLSGVHTHMTNTLNTPIEALELQFPMRVRRYALRRGSGGDGAFRGGDGIVRETEFLGPATVTLLTERRQSAPYGLRGGGPGAAGENISVQGRCGGGAAAVQSHLQGGARRRAQGCTRPEVAAGGRRAVLKPPASPSGCGVRSADSPTIAITLFPLRYCPSYNAARA